MESKETVVVYLLKKDFKKFVEFLDEDFSQIRYMSLVSATAAIYFIKSDFDKIIVKLAEKQLDIKYLTEKSDKTSEQIITGLDWFL